MNKKILLASVFVLAIVFSACGDDASTSTVEPDKNLNDNKTSDDEIETLDDLPKCKKIREGDSLYVLDEDSYYICEDGHWNNSKVKDNDSKKSSGSKKFSSSSQKVKDSSSSEKSENLGNSSSSNKVSSSSQKVKDSSSSEKSENLGNSSGSKKFSSSSQKVKDSSSSEKSENLGNSSSSNKVSSSSKISSSSSVEMVIPSSSSKTPTEEFGVCDETKSNELVKSETGKYYECTNNKWNVVIPSKLDIKLGKRCNLKNIHDTLHYCPNVSCEEDDVDVYECKVSAVVVGDRERKSYEWEQWTKYQIDTFGLECSNELSGTIMKGKSGTEYVCNANHFGEPFMTLDSLKSYVAKSSCKTGNTIKYKGASWSCLNGNWKFDENAAVKGSIDGYLYSYGTVWIGFQNWMTDNSAEILEEGMYCYDDKEQNCYEMGALYEKRVASLACPEGWHLPTTAEWNELKLFIMNDQKLADDTNVGEFLRIKSISSWPDFNGLDTYGFRAIPTGHRSHIENIGYYNPFQACFWSASQYDSFCLSALHNSIYYSENSIPQNHLSEPVRCVEN